MKTAIIVVVITVFGTIFPVPRHHKENGSIYISSLYVYDSALPVVFNCGTDIACELALDEAWEQAMGWDRLLDERVYP